VNGVRQLRLFDEQLHAGRKRRRRCLVARNKELVDDAQQLAHVEQATIRVRIGQVTDQCFVRRAAHTFDLRGEVSLHLHNKCGNLDLALGSDRRADRFDRDIGPQLEPRLVLARDAELLGDDEHRQVDCERAKKFDLGRVDEPAISSSMIVAMRGSSAATRAVVNTLSTSVR